MADRGLEHVVMGDSKISYVGGETGELVFRGYPVQRLVGHWSYEAIVHLLLFGDLPTSDPPEPLRQELAAARRLPSPLEQLTDLIPAETSPIEALRTSLSGLGTVAPFGYPPTTAEGLRLIGACPTMLTRFVRRKSGAPATPVDPQAGHVGNYLTMLTGHPPTADQTRALEDYFILLADHGMNASTFALCVVISTESDLVSGATAALGALKGPAHGGAPSRVAEMLDAIGTIDQAETWLSQALARRERLYGFGHRAYKVEDPRAIELKRIARTVADPERLRLAEQVERMALDLLHKERPGRRLYTNVEYYGAIVLEAVGIPRGLFTPTFALARTAGWTAHAVEQAADNRLIRPEVRYTGEAVGRAMPGPSRASG
ncbi:MAG: citrate/2-methylcitrate synthase [Thermoplasmata archaeon]